MQVYFDPKEVSFERLLDLFFDTVDPTTKDRQGNDRGDSSIVTPIASIVPP